MRAAKWLLHQRRRPFNPIFAFSDPLKVHISSKAVSFLLRSSAFRPYAFTYRLFPLCAGEGCPDLPQRKRTYFALVNLMTFLRSQLPDSINIKNKLLLNLTIYGNSSNRGRKRPNILNKRRLSFRTVSKNNFIIMISISIKDK
jgi:hypothetical protein